MAAGRRAGQRGHVVWFCSKAFKNVSKFLNLKIQCFGQRRLKMRANAGAAGILSGRVKEGMLAGFVQK